VIAALRPPHLVQHGFVDEPLLGQEDELLRAAAPPQPQEREAASTTQQPT